MREIESIEEFNALLSKNSTIESIAFQGINLGNHEEQLSSNSFKECVFMGCNIPSHIIQKLVDDTNFIFPNIPLPYKMFKNRLYNESDLYSDGYDDKVYQHYLDSSRKNNEGISQKGFAKTIKESLARSIHDHAISDGIEDLLESIDEKKIVAIMGGHGLSRTDDDYVHIVWMAKRITEDGFILLSGGGPGAMEATHLGAWFAGLADVDLKDALAILQKSPSYKDENWLASALDIIKKYPRKEHYFSIGIPTWLYGHEPSSPFAAYIAKFFTNSIREESLLALAKGGIVFAPGSAGTMQEIFQDACQNHYKSFDYASPMLFLNRACWMRDKPVYNLLQQIQKNGFYKNLFLDINDDPDKLIVALKAFQDGKLPRTEKHRINVGTFNVLNLVSPEVEYYGKKKYSRHQYDLKTDWIAEQLDRMKAEIVVFQEIFNKSALEDVLKKSKLFKGEYYLEVGTRHKDDPFLPMVAIASKYPIKSTEVFIDIEELAGDEYNIPSMRFSRPIMKNTIEIYGQDYVFFGTHLKSKRPRYSELEKEDREKTAAMIAKGTLRSLIQRGMEASQLRSILVDSLAEGLPHFLMGDLNDAHNAVTNEIIGGLRPNKPSSPKYQLQNGEDKDAYDKSFDERLEKYYLKMEDYHQNYQFKLFQAKELLAQRSYQDHYFTHIHNGHHQALDHVYLSNDFSPFNPVKLGRVKQIKLFNDHLEDDTLGRVRNEYHESDHGQVVVKLELTSTEWV
jgi:predicted Rossmann-fold nucleotide-binding protein